MSSSALSAGPPLAARFAIQDLDLSYWRWRALHQPITTDDVPRIERPPGWSPDWSPEAVEKSRCDLSAFEASLRSIDQRSLEPEERTDLELMRSALARARWELDQVRSWQRSALFYVDQTVGSLHDLLVRRGRWDQARSESLIARIERIPATLSHGAVNLSGPDHLQRPLAEIALSRLDGIERRLRTVARSLGPLNGSSARTVATGLLRASAALVDFREWLRVNLESAVDDVAIGRDAFEFFLERIAFVPHTPSELVRLGEMEWARASALAAVEAVRAGDRADLSLPRGLASLIKRETKAEGVVRDFFESRDLLTVPDEIGHFVHVATPRYLEPLADFGMQTDLGSPTRLGDDGCRYVVPPRPNMGFFERSDALDPRTNVAHEGTHYLQLMLSWRNPDASRRHYYDSTANEGIAFYAEEMLLRAGLFDDSPRTRQIVYDLMRLRAARVGLEVRIALGEWSVDMAAEHLMRTAGMDPTSARQEAAMYAATPGLALSYQVGKSQALAFLARARLAEGPAFSLRRFHDQLWRNGNVPIALLEREYLSRVPTTSGGVA